MNVYWICPRCGVSKRSRRCAACNVERPASALGTVLVSKGGTSNLFAGHAERMALYTARAAAARPLFDDHGEQAEGQGGQS